MSERELSVPPDESDGSPPIEVTSPASGEQLPTGECIDAERLHGILTERANGRVAVDEVYALVALAARAQYDDLKDRITALESTLASALSRVEDDAITRIREELATSEAMAEARLRVIEEQQKALEAYQFWDWRARLRRAVRPQLGILYQYDPRPMQIPRRYARTLPAPGSPSISIVTPSYRSGQFLERTLLSVLEQEYPDLELIVQDGGSQDKTSEILEEYRPKLKAAVSEPDDGQSDALNRGFTHATGEVMAYLNADDLLLPGSLAYVGQYFRDHPEVDVVYGHRIVIDEYDAEIGRWVMPPHDDEVLKWVDYLPQETMFWRRRIWDRAGGSIDSSFRFAMDWDLILRFQAAEARFVRLPRFLGAFRVHPHQKTSAEIDSVGDTEMSRLRERLHGRHISHAEAYRHSRRYLLQHRIFHWAWRLGLLRH